MTQNRNMRIVNTQAITVMTPMIPQMKNPEKMMK